MSSSSQMQFESLGDPYHWWCTADSMKDASEILFEAIAVAQRQPSDQELDLARRGFRVLHPTHDRRSVYVLLVGFCLENLLKAEYMRVNGPNLTAGQLPPEIKAHDLLALSALVRFSSNRDESQMLGVASQAIISWGRYPGGPRHDKGAMGPPECFDLEAFRRNFEVVYWRLTKAITEGWAD